MRRLILVDISDDCVNAHPDKCVCCPCNGVYQERGVDEWIPCCSVYASRSPLEGSYEDGFVRLPECIEDEQAAAEALRLASEALKLQRDTWEVNKQLAERLARTDAPAGKNMLATALAELQKLDSIDGLLGFTEGACDD